MNYKKNDFIFRKSCVNIEWKGSENMSENAKWIWYDFDFELYHHFLLSCRRQEKGCDYPCMWHISSPEKSVNFYKNFTAAHDTVINVKTYSKGMVRIEGKLQPVNTDIRISAGEHSIHIELYDREAFPALYINSEFLVSDESWTADAHDGTPLAVGCTPAFRENDDPRVFPFLYEEIFPVKTEKINGGILYDYGRETFARVTLSNISDNTALCYGESREEALDFDNAIIRETLNKNDELTRPPRAFRYLHIKFDEAENIKIKAEYEYLPLKDIASFRCDVPEIEKIWDICAYTFHLNSRECFLDGIKRDRWVWSGDAYQSFMINRYLYNDPDITERTIISLFGKPPYKIHINRINDYSAYLIMAVWEHYFATDRKAFLRRVFPQVSALYDFIVSRLSPEGYSVPKDVDWVFIDWGVLDKEGAHCVEQILLWKVYGVMASIAAVLGKPDVYSEKAELLRKNIIRDYWNEGKGAFIDSFTSGKNFVSRQTNVFAVLFDFASAAQTESIIHNVFENDTLPQITTPYFKLYELLALCKCGRIRDAQNYILSYWGGMLQCGATSVWEAYDPTKTGAEHYAMYGSLYGKSLCHAWGSGPILLLMKYVAGVSVTEEGGSGFEVKPAPGIFRSFQAVCPVGSGTVSVNYEKGTYEVLTDVKGGKFICGGEKTELLPGKTYTFT